MSAAGLRQAQEKMQDAGVAQAAIDVFTHYYRQLEEGATGLIREDTIRPLTEVDHLSDTEVDPAAARDALARTVLIKLNGGLGTSMGMDRAKSLLPVRELGERGSGATSSPTGEVCTFLDLIVEQVRRARAEHEVALPLLLMNSFRTAEDTRAALAAHDDLAVDGLPPDFLQNTEPKLRADDLTPVEWPADPSLEWCPPGHGDIYTALEASGLLQTLLDRGYRYASVSNSDNLGAAPDATLAGWFAASGAPYAAELCRRTAADRKGGHLAVRAEDGQLILRDTAQTAPEEMHHFTDEHRHPYFHTNNLWWDLEQLAATLAERESVLGLPLIKNTKNVDPGDSTSPEVVQVETAMGAAIEVFAGATAIVVGRERFLPVKTTNDLLLLRSDVYQLGERATLDRVVERAPLVDLDPAHYKRIGDFEARFPGGAPSLREATSLTVRGEWTFGAEVTVRGAVELADGEAGTIADGSVLE